MKSISPAQIMALLGFALTIFACQKDIDYLPGQTDNDLNQIILNDKTTSATEGTLILPDIRVLHTGTTLGKIYDDFEFNVIERNCSRDGKSFKILMEKDRNFRFHWDANGEIISRSEEVKCVYANQLTGYVTRISDDYTKYFTMFLASGPDQIEAFAVTLDVSICVDGAATINASTAQGEDFSYLWEVDGNHAGHFNKITCVCGSYATAIVTRLEDGSRVRKSVPLPNCNTSEN